MKIYELTNRSGPIITPNISLKAVNLAYIVFKQRNIIMKIVGLGLVITCYSKDIVSDCKQFHKIKKIKK